ncbi:RDD family protein [Mesoplasma photuris]|uniref:RDD family protein n=1 Tax=Mesoplasma photuris TaxID=217731 RepID=UPI0004E1764B|nr:RDD family protein [Mesoplasma photuris]
MNKDRVLAALVNFLICATLIGLVVYVIFWYKGEKPLGQKLFNTACPSDKKEQLIFGIFSVIMYISLILWVVNIYFWYKNEDSIATKLTNWACK